nr:GreA [uncultured bacterium]
MRHADGLQGAGSALRPAQGADAGAQVHQALRVGRDALRGQQGLGLRPQRTFVCGPREVVAKTECSGQHPFDVAIEDGHPLAEAERGDGCRGGAPDTGQRGQHLAAARELAAMLHHHRLRTAVQVARAAVVAQAAPEREHVVQRRRGQRLHVGKTLQEPGVVVDHGDHLRLLQHHLGQPHAVRVLCALPGQPVAAMLPLPAHHAAGQALQLHSGSVSVRRGACRWFGPCTRDVFGGGHQAVHLLQQFAQAPLARFKLGDALLQVTRRGLDALQCLAPAIERAPPLAQLLFDLAGRRLAPRLDPGLFDDVHALRSVMRVRCRAGWVEVCGRGHCVAVRRQGSFPVVDALQPRIAPPERVKVGAGLRVSTSITDSDPGLELETVGRHDGHLVRRPADPRTFHWTGPAPPLPTELDDADSDTRVGTPRPPGARGRVVSSALVRDAGGTAETTTPPARNPARGYMTAAGAERYRRRLQQLVQRRDELLASPDDDLPERSELATLERELAQVSAVLQGAIVIRLASPPRDEVRFGAEVVVEDDRGSRSRFQLVGENEAAPERGLVNWFSPLGRALAGARLGQRVEWTTPAGRGAYVVREISYP